ncbi:XRE family transcriptional regulator [Planobispora longispora]|nr:XRE family transcriptional regulator [Planobispora longispora]
MTDIPPELEGVTDPAEFVAALGTLRRWSGLSYRQLASRAQAAGDVLPPSTMAGALGRAVLPREELVAALVRACGCDEATVAGWIAVRRRLAVSGSLPVLAPSAPPESEVPISGPATPSGSGLPIPIPGPAGPPENDAPTPGPAVPSGSGVPDSGAPGTVAPPDAGGGTVSGRRLLPVMAAAVVAFILLGLGGGALAGLRALASAQTPAQTPTQPPTPTPAQDSLPSPNRSMGLPDGWYRVVPAHVADRGLCVGEGRERNGRTTRELAVQRPCRGLSPDTYVKAVGPGVHQIQWHHPVHGVGCLTVDQAWTGAEALIAPAKCTGAAHQRFLLERSASAGTAGHRLRPVHSGLCVGVLGGAADVDNGAELVQDVCNGGADQVFFFVAAPDLEPAAPEPEPAGRETAGREAS